MSTAGWTDWGIVCFAAFAAGYATAAVSWAFGSASRAIEQAFSEERAARLRRSEARVAHSFDKPRKLSEGGYDC